MNFTISRATKADADFIAKTIMEAIGDELCVGLAGSPENLPAVKYLFTSLAGHDKSQYSYINTIIAKTPEGENIGALIYYDGASLNHLRLAFVTGANNYLGWKITSADFEEWGDETGPEQIYLDSLYVEPDFRGQGVASSLIKWALEHSPNPGKPYGLLVEPENTNARRLYEKLGFRKVGINNFFTTPMYHMQIGQEK